MSVKNTHQNNTATAEMPTISQPTAIGRYQVLRTLGSGGMGEVLLCRDPQSENEVALKVVDPAGAPRLRVEAEALSKIDHPNVVRLISSDLSGTPESGKRPFIAMEYIEGYSLLHLIRARRLTIVDILDYTVQLLTGLEAIHRSGFLHRDLKPANIMIDKNRRLRIIDFGIAQPHRHGNGIQVQGPNGPLTTQGHIIGTMNYMAPEVLCGDRASTSSDLYSVGVIVWEMIHHRLPFSTRDRNLLAQNVVKQNLEWSPAIGDFLPDGLIPLISRILAKTTDKRPAINAALIEEFKKMLLGLTLPEPLRRPCPTNKTHRRPVFDKKVLAQNSIADVEIPYLALTRDTLRLTSAHPTDQETVATYLTLKKTCADARGERIKRRLLESRALAIPRPTTWQARLHAALIPIAIGVIAFSGVGLLRYLDISLLSRSRLTGVPLTDIVRSRGLRAPAGQSAESRLVYDIETVGASGETRTSTETRTIQSQSADSVIWEHQTDGQAPRTVEIPIGTIPSNVFFAPLSGDQNRVARLETYSTDFLNLAPGREFTIHFQSPLNQEVETQTCRFYEGGNERLLKTDFNALEVKCQRSLARGDRKLRQSEETYLFLPEIGVILHATQTVREQTASGSLLFKQTKRSALNIEKSTFPALRSKGDAR